MKWIWDSSIARSIFGGFLTFMIPVLLFSLIMNGKSLEISRAEITRSYQSSILMLEKQMNDKFKAMANSVDSIYTDPDLIYLNYSNTDDVNQLLTFSYMIDNIKLFSNASLLSGNIKVLLKNRGKSISSITGYGDIDESDRKKAINIKSKDVGRWRLDNGNLIFVRGQTQNSENNGIIAMANVEKADVLNFLNNMNIGDKEARLFISDTDGNMLFSNENVDIDKVMLSNRINESEGEVNQFVFSFMNNKYRVIFAKSPSTNMTIGMYFSEDYAMRSIAGTKVQMIIFFIFTLLLAMLFTWIVYRNLLKPFHLLVEGMKKVGQGEFNTRIKIITKKDFGFVFTQFNNMASDTEKLINDVYIAKLNHQNTQLKLLQSRINPHFLYNCLNFIYQMSMGEDNEGAARMASYLGKYFRFIAKCSHEMITLKDECENVVNLLEIQSMRFKGRISYEMNLDKDKEHILVPSLIIQPIVENAIIHGIENLPGKIYIRISVASDSERILIFVDDDGNAIPEKELEEIRNNLNMFDANGKGMGLNNTHWRLKLKYGEKSGLKIENMETKGVRVTLIIEPDKEW